MEIRKANLKDAEEITALWKEFMETHAKNIIKKNPEQKKTLERKKNADFLFKKFLIKNIRSRNGLVLVAADGNKMVGYSLNFIKDNIPVFAVEKIGHISDLYVAPEFRGKGISSKFKDMATDWFKKKGMTVASIEVYNENSYAHSIYNKWGFFDSHIELKKMI
ncbi:MAG: GNAT family N-acetyltransferase [Nanoarchaeota archaeon]|nr:GNAT family N-acetyltransferase [Nanoarchaeota archaeon]